MAFQSGFRLVSGDDLNNMGATANTAFGNVYLTGLLNESAQDTITAHAGGGQASAFQLTKEMSRVSTVATAGDSVVLPASAAGLTIILENASANPMQVYGLGSDTINGVAAATGVSQMQGSVVFYTCYSAGAWYANGLGTGYAGSFETVSTVTGLTAHAGGGQGSATPLTAMVNQISTCATGGDSVILPTNSVGMCITVINNGAASCNVFCDSGSTMNGSSNGSAACAAGSVLICYCSAANKWVTK
jgi:hypothetical protein